MKQHNIFPECNVDTNLMGLIIGGYSKHKSTCNEVVKAVNGTDCFAIGVIDADKRPATMDAGFVEYKQAEKVDGKNTLKYLIHEQYNADPAIVKQFFDGTLTKKDLVGRYLID